MKGIIPWQMFEWVIGAVEGVASGGGKQQEGKKRMKRVGKVDLFSALLQVR
jgi:hypothetical protein